MTILADAAVFPNNIVNTIYTSIDDLDSEIEVFKRPLRPSDPNVAVGTFGSLWTPEEDSLEMRGDSAVGRSEPSLQRYRLTVQCLIKDMDEERGLAKHSVLSQMVRAMLYRDNTLRVGLAALTVTANGITERAQRWGITTQRYLNNEIQGSFVYLSTLEFWCETESI